MRKFMRKRLKKGLSLVLTFIMVFNVVFSFQMEQAHAKINVNNDKLPDGYVLVKKTDKTIAPGISETEIVTNTTKGDKQQIDYMMEVQMSKDSPTKVVASYGSNYDASSWELATMAEQAKGYEDYMKKNGIKNETVVAAVNADFFHMGTGEPQGALVMNGKIIKQPIDTYFCITKEGKAEIRDASQPMDDCEQAVGGGPFLVKNGEPQMIPDMVRMTRAAIGLKADGSIVTFTTHGISDQSSGHTVPEMASLLAAAGCVTAINLDGGGSATYMARYEGTNALEARNNPSDGKLRAVSSGLLFLSTSVKDGKFDHSSISPNDEVYTPNQTVKFNATGVDGGGGEAPMPAGVTWAVEDQSIGTIDANTGVVTLKDKEGTLVVNQMYQGRVVGTASIEVRHPDEISFKTEEISLGFEAESSLGLEVRWQKRNVHIKGGDIEWEVSNPKMGHFDGNTFITSDGETLEGTVTGYSKYNRDVKGSIHVIVGKLPTVAWDFEDQKQINEETGEETIIPAKEYWKIGHDGEDTPFITMASAEDTGVSAEIVDIDTGEVRMGKNALKLSYDFTNSANTTRGAYFGTKDNYEIPGSPTAIGVWVYAPEGIDNFWLRGQVAYQQANGEWVEAGSSMYVDFTYQTNQELPDHSHVSKEDAEINWTGWKYLEADLTGKGATKFKLAKGATFRIMYVPGIEMGSKTAGEIYLDNMQFVYGTNVDDTDSPIIDKVQYSTDNQKFQTFGDNDVITSNKISFMSTFHDVENKYTKGMEYDLIRMYVDGVNVGVKGQDESGGTIFADNFIVDSSKNVSYLYDMELANGVHSIRTVIRDKGGNETEQTHYFTVKGENAKHTTLSLEPATTENPVLNKPYDLEIKTNRLEDLDEITTKIAIKKEFAQNYEIIWNEDFGKVEDSYNSAKGVLTLKGKRKTEAAVTGEGVVATIRLKMPSDVKKGTQLTYLVQSGQATYNSEKPEHYAKSFSTKKTSIEIIAPLTLKTDTMFVGMSGKIYVVDASGKAVEGAEIFNVDTNQSLGTTNADGYIETDALNQAVAMFSIYAKKGEDVSFILTDYSFAIAGNEDGSPQYVMSHASKDVNTQKSVTWFTDPFKSQNKAIMQIATKADFDANKEKAFKNVTGTTELIKLDGSANVEDNHAFRLNSVIATGLSSGTAYVYRVGDGDKWSDLKSFTTPYKNKNVNFFVLGDIQTLDMDRTNRIADALMNNGIKYDFGLQTGDAVDNGAKFEYWDGIANLYGELFNSLDMIHVFGNHEYEGDLTGDNSKAIYNIPSENNGDYYSFEYGNMYFAVINFTKDTNRLNRAASWLVEDAKKSNATWKVLAIHQPAYYTNPTGGNDIINKIIPPACDAAGIDFVFSGHDHTYNRTKPLKGGKVDKDNGTVYLISGTTGDKTYPTTDTGFEFDKYITTFDGVYMSVSATTKEFTIEAREANGNILDTYTRTKEYKCDKDGHEYEIVDGYAVCIHCKETISLKSFTGIAKDKATGKYMGFLGGQKQIGWKQFADTMYYFNADGYSEDVEIVYHDDPSCMIRERTKYYCPAANEYKEIVGTRAPLHEYETQPDGTRICKVCGWRQVSVDEIDVTTEYDGYYYTGGKRTPKIVVSYTDEKGKKTVFRQGADFEYLVHYGKDATDSEPAVNNVLPGKGYFEIIPIEINIGDAVDRHRGSITGRKYFSFDILVQNPKRMTASDVTMHEATLTWDKASNITGYELYQYSDETKAYEMIQKFDNPNVNTYTVKQLTSSTKYKFKVRSYLNVDGKTYYSSDSKELNVTTKALAVAAPKNVTSSNVTQDALTLSWDKAADVEGYQVYQYNEKTNKYDLAKTVKTTSCTIQNLNPNKQYAFKVRAYAKADGKTYYSSYTTTYKVRTKALTVTTPENVSLTDIKHTSATISWDKVSNVSGYKVYKLDTKAKKYVAIATLTQTSYKLQNLAPETTYVYKVRAFVTIDGTNHYSDYTKPKTLKTKAEPVPTAINAPKLNQIKASKGILTLTWNKVSDATGYNIYHYNRKTLKYENIGWTKNTTVQLKDQPKGEIDTYRVKAYYKKNGKTVISKYSNAQSAKLFDSTKLSSVTQKDEQLKFSWNKVNGVGGYSIYRYDNVKKAWQYLGATTKTTYTDKAAVAGKRYLYRVLPYGRVNGVAFFGPYSSSVEGMMLKETKIKDVKSYVGKIQFSWDKVPGAQGYNVYRYNNKTKKWETMKSVLKGTTYNDTNVKAGEVYRYRVRPYYWSSTHKVKYGEYTKYVGIRAR